MNNVYKKPKQLRAYLALAWYSLRAQTRNPATFAFGFIFPIVFISIFGLIGGGGASVKIGVPLSSDTNNPIIQTLEKSSYVKLARGSKDELSKQLVQDKVGGILEVEKQGERYITHLTVSANPQQSGTITSVVTGVVDKLNLQLSQITDPPITLKREEVSNRPVRYIDFALPGQIGFSLLSTAVFGTVFGLIYLKKSLVLKRMFATPTKALTILLAQGTSRLIVALLQTILILAIGVLVFKFYLPHGIITFLELLLLSTIGLVAFLGFGYFFAGIANNENSAGPLVNLITLPQFLLSGTFFSTDSFPSWVQPIANNLPLSYFNAAIRKITIEGGTLTDTIPYMLGLLAWGAVMYILASRTFKWE